MMTEEELAKAKRAAAKYLPENDPKISQEERDLCKKHRGSSLEEAKMREEQTKQTKQ